jgi:LysR family transcriptional activator of nhaA
VNYKHLHYFMQVAKLGSVTRASEQLHLTPQTISGQIQLLEEAMGSALLAKSGRSLVLTDAGRLVLGYAEEIFSMGAELSEAVREHKAKVRLLEFKVGVVDAVPKAIAYRLLEPATQLPQRVRIVCREGKLEGLLAALAMHRLDLVISDTPMPTSISVKAFNHQLGASGVSFFAAPALAETFEGPFPRCLDGARMLMPGDDSAVGRRLRAWFQERSLQPLVVGEFDDSALAKEFGRRGAGVFVAPTVLAREIERQFGVKEVGAAAEVLAEFFAISVERRVTHPCVVAMTQAARNELFAPPAKARRTRRPASL